jgi:hypothetical protein
VRVPGEQRCRLGQEGHNTHRVHLRGQCLEEEMPSLLPAEIVRQPHPCDVSGGANPSSIVDVAVPKNVCVRHACRVLCCLQETRSSRAGGWRAWWRSPLTGWPCT